MAGRLQALVRKGLIKPDARTFAGEDAFRFGNILIRDAAYDSMAKRHRAELHERLAAWAEGRTGSGVELDEIIGHHLEQAYTLRVELGPGGAAEAVLADRAAARLLRAGRRALRRGDIHAARALLERAAALLPERDPRRLALVPELGLVLTEAGALTRAEELLSSLVDDPSVDGTLVLAARSERVALRLLSDPRGGWERDLEIVEAALPALDAENEHDAAAHRRLARGWYLVGLVRGLWSGHVARGEEALERALRHARAAGDRWQEDEIVGRLGFAAWSGPQPVADAVRRCADLLDEAPDDLVLEACCRRWIGCLVARHGRFEEARELITAAASAYEELGARLDAAATSAFGHADVEWLAGDLAAAERALRKGYEALGSLGDLGTRATVAAFLSRVLQAGGRTDEAESFARLAAETASEHDLWSQVLHRLTSARLAAGAGRLAEAEELARTAVAILDGTDLLDLRGDALLDLADVLHLAGREQETRETAEAALDLYLRKGNEVAAERARAVVARAATTTA